jgi:hypothetical protein
MNHLEGIEYDGVQFKVYRDDQAEAFLIDNTEPVTKLAERAIENSVNRKGSLILAINLTNAILHPTYNVSLGGKLAHPEEAVKHGELNPGIYKDLRCVIASNQANDELVGLQVSHNNTSGRLAQLKMNVSPDSQLPVIGGKRYAWQQLAVVQPEYWGRGIGAGLTELSLRERHGQQPVTAYTWPELFSRVARSLQHNAMQPTGTQMEKLAGDTYELVRYQGRVATVHAALRENHPGLPEALEAAIAA